MNPMKYPAHPWQFDCLVVALETIELRGERVPSAYSQVTVENRQITTSLHYPVAWGGIAGAGWAGRPGRNWNWHWQWLRLTACARCR
jgi:hypothetical protein